MLFFYLPLYDEYHWLDAYVNIKKPLYLTTTTTTTGCKFFSFLSLILRLYANKRHGPYVVIIFFKKSYQNEFSRFPLLREAITDGHNHQRDQHHHIENVW